ncbi:MAG: HYR domain-containing protein [Saprospiraceae bacterium]
MTSYRGEACIPTSIGVLNPMLPQPTPNGGSTAIQAQPTVRVTCDPFTVTITDEEEAVCGLYADYIDYPAAAVEIVYGECEEVSINVPQSYNVADVNLTVAGTAGDLGNLTVTLISPEGTQVPLVEGICNGDNMVNFTFDGDPEFEPSILTSCGNLNVGGDPLVPVGNIEIFNGEAAQGEWIVQIGHNGRVSTAAANLSFNLSISGREAYTQGDVTLDNDLDECGAEFTWLHPILFDNCPGGTVQMQIIFEETEEQVNTALPIFPENTENTYFFEVGVTEVRYTLTDAAGNISGCSFEVEVLDVQFPTLTCPPDRVVQLAGGECTTTDYPVIPVTADDNCPGYTFSSIPPGTPVPIGDTVVTLIVTDASGNATPCTYNLSVLEFIPVGTPACIAEQNVTLGYDCVAEITADMVLSGDDYRCYDNYIVTLYYVDANGQPGAIIPTSPVAGIDLAGETIIAEVCNPADGLCCWGYLNIEFKDAPEFICPPDVQVLCTDSTLPAALGEPIITSCVPGGATVEFEDVVTDNGMCGSPRMLIQRTWTVTDGEGNSSSCVQTITMRSFTLDQVVFPPNYDGIDEPVVDCSDALANPSLLSTAELGVPMVGGAIPLSVVSFCSGAVNMTEERFDICENSYIIFRTWRVINQCAPNPLASALTHVQTIRVEDADGPDLVCPEDMTISTGPNQCLGNFVIPALTVEDACSMVTYQVAINGDTLPYRQDHQYMALGLEIGAHEIRYIATDRCGKWSTCTFTLSVEDWISPTAVCDDQLNITINNGDAVSGVEGVAAIAVEDIDEGSNDNCDADVFLEISRTGEEGSWVAEDAADPHVYFTCEDVGTVVYVYLRATDDAGNQNICWVEIVPEDKRNPVCEDLPSVEVLCNELPLDFYRGYCGCMQPTQQAWKRCSMTYSMVVTTPLATITAGQ